MSTDEGPAAGSSLGRPGGPRERRAIEVRGIVQGVGFRPFVYALAQRFQLAGWVRNDGQGVQIEAEGDPSAIERFVSALRSDPPLLAVVDSVESRAGAPIGERGFRIELSRNSGGHSALVSPDMAICSDCLRELFDPADRRFRYPFINCTNCGPRFTITKGVPYDRVSTTMAAFEMCSDCRREYDDPSDRRFHAQPNACPVCGPHVSLLDSCGRDLCAADPIRAAAQRLRAGDVVAVKGLGGYHLACDPFASGAAARLRERKRRADKPFALMAADPAQARRLILAGTDDEELLSSPARPILVLDRRPDSGVADAVAPRQQTLGVMLAYTPLHHLLLADFGGPLVMTSGNRSDEPIAYRDEEAIRHLQGLADSYLTHNRPIHIRCDDSLVRSSGTGESRIVVPLRRSRGYAPAPLRVAMEFPRPLLACGGELKNAFCLAKERHVFLSHYIGDMQNWETLRSFREGVEHFQRLFDVRPELVACDLHPEYLATRYARELEDAGMPVVGIQHHEAHVAACLADNRVPTQQRFIGVALDGTGWGPDGTTWGGELFVGSLREGFRRRARLGLLRLPGGEAAIRRPWRVAAAALIRLYGEEQTLRLPLPLVQRAGERAIRQIARMLESDTNSPLTSSAGRLFDAIAAIADVPGSDQVTYEGQAAIELELAMSDPEAIPYSLSIVHDQELLVADVDCLIREAVEDALAGRSASAISARFHTAMAAIVVELCRRLRRSEGLSDVALSGGVFQNMRLLRGVIAELEADGFTVLRHQRVPPNDGGICLGQAALARNVLERN
jgi:hydrogenase maturation protein HypF